MTSALLLKPLPLPTTTTTSSPAHPPSPPSLYAPTRLPATFAAGLPRRAPRLRPDGLCESCVCEICICGTHHCPPTPRHLQTAADQASLPPTSHSRSTFPPPPSTAYPPRAGRPLGALHIGGDWSGSSSYTSTFQPHPPSTTLPSPPVPSPPLFDVSLPLSTSTTSSSSYPRHPLPPRLAPRPPSPLPSTGSFIASSTYSSLFSPPLESPSPPPPFLPHPSLHPPSSDDRTWTTEAHTHYTGTPTDRRSPLRPSHSPHNPTTHDTHANGWGLSEARARYVRYEGQRAAQEVRPVDARHDDDDGHARDMRSEGMRAYAKHGVRGAPAVMVRVAPALSVGGERFEGSSVMKDSYGRIDPAVVVRHARREEAKVQCEEEDRTWHTESRMHYGRKKTGPAYVRPVVRKGVGWEGEEGEGGEWQTESGRRFVEHGDCVRESWVPEVKALEETAFEGGSTSHAAYRGVGGGRRGLIRPVSALREGEGRNVDERVWVTESRYHYQKKDMEACPAGELEERTVKVGHGHQLYEKRPEETGWRKLRATGQRSNSLW